MRAACSQGAVADCGFQRVIWRRRRLKGNGLMSDDLLFIDDEPAQETVRSLAQWQVMIVDDEPAVHEVTRLVMSGFTFDGKGLEFIHCYSAGEAVDILSERNDIALILLDVVMETDSAGLDLARYIREDLKNLNVRIVLRTGQPGQAPEEHVIKTYDINDYKEKTDLTHGKLMTVFYASLRAYRDIMRLERARLGLRRAIDAITEVYDSHNLRRFASAVLEQVNYLLNLDGDGLCASRVSAYAASSEDGRLKVLAATEAYSGLQIDEDVEQLPSDVQEAFHNALRDRRSQFGAHYFTCYDHSKAGSETVVYMSFADVISADARVLLEIFTANVAITYESLLLREEIEDTQRSTIFILGEAVEKRSKETGAHVKRVGEISALLGQLSGMNLRDVEFLRQAAPLHDVGKIGIPDRVLNKPGKLDPDEWAIMQTHALIGFEVLNKSDKRVLQLGATIAHEHHESWNGEGYPRGLKGADIHIAGRIVAIADVLDALVSPRCYKIAWQFSDAVDYIRQGAGRHFDPELVALFLANLPAIEEIYRKYPD